MMESGLPGKRRDGDGIVLENVLGGLGSGGIEMELFGQRMD